MSIINIIEAASNLYKSHTDLKNFAKWPEDLTNSNLPPRMIPLSQSKIGGVCYI